MKLTRVATTIAAIVLLNACASGPTYSDYAAQITPVAEDQGRIYFYRIATIGAAVQPAVKLNGEVVGNAVPQGFFFVDRTPGEYEISATTEAERDLSLILDAGDEKYVRLEMKMGFFVGQVKPVLVEDSVGEIEIQKTKFVGAN